MNLKNENVVTDTSGVLTSIQLWQFSVTVSLLKIIFQIQKKSAFLSWMKLMRCCQEASRTKSTTYSEKCLQMCRYRGGRALWLFGHPLHDIRYTNLGPSSQNICMNTVCKLSCVKSVFTKGKVSL